MKKTIKNYELGKNMRFFADAQDDSLHAYFQDYLTYRQLRCR